MQINFYCDESCYLQNDGNDFMVLGAIYCPNTFKKTINKNINKIKYKYGFSPSFEIKWTKISNKTIGMIKEILKYIKEKPFIRIRTLIATGKKSLTFSSETNYNEWYYKMYFTLLKKNVHDIGVPVVDENQKIITFNKFKFFLDKKDSNSVKNAEKICICFRNLYYKVSIPSCFQYEIVDSKQMNLVQIIDIIIGAISYKIRNIKSSAAKLELVNYIEKLFDINLNLNSNYNENKFNNFIWVPSFKYDHE